MLMKSYWNHSYEINRSQFVQAPNFPIKNRLNCAKSTKRLLSMGGRREENATMKL